MRMRNAAWWCCSFAWQLETDFETVSSETKTNLWDSQATTTATTKAALHAEDQQTKTSSTAAEAAQKQQTLSNPRSEGG